MTALYYAAHARLPTERAHGLQIARMCEAFAQAGAAVTVLKPKRRQPGPRFNGTGFREHYGIRAPLEVKDLGVLDLPIPYSWRERAPLAQLWRAAESSSFVGSLARFVLSNRVSLKDAILYTRDAETLLALSGLKRLAGYRLVFESHSVHRRAGRLLARSRTDLWVVLTTPLRDYWVSRGVDPGRIIVEPDAVEPGAFAPRGTREEAKAALGLPGHSRVIGYVGRFQMMGMDKGLSVLAQAFGRLAMSRPDLRLLLVGGPLEAAAAVMEALPGPVKDRVTVKDYVPPGEVPQVLAACDVGVVPNPATEHYSLCVSPLKLFEYWAAGVPVIATDLPSLRDVLQDGVNAVLARPGDAHSMAQALAAVLDDPAAATRLAAKGREEAGRRTWRGRAERILQAVKEAVPA